MMNVLASLEGSSVDGRRLDEANDVERRNVLRKEKTNSEARPHFARDCQTRFFFQRIQRILDVPTQMCEVTKKMVY